MSISTDDGRNFKQAGGRPGNVGSSKVVVDFYQGVIALDRSRGPFRLVAQSALAKAFLLTPRDTDVPGA